MPPELRTSGFRPHTFRTVAVENLADEDYRIHGSGVNEPGRNFVFTVDSRF